eukprot:TRINITY_DN3092_c0_g1_i1.p1 TRINITY_DN3092_c0_g1~~TRINITY_DN3092_c0_g1_i1.p1  ORF type:complete len:217 (-),score=43.72 TRINITY_DN3092_c0_g1_i1:53-703(-)
MSVRTSRYRISENTPLKGEIHYENESSPMFLIRSYRGTALTLVALFFFLILTAAIIVYVRHIKDKEPQPGGGGDGSSGGGGDGSSGGGDGGVVGGDDDDDDEISLISLHVLDTHSGAPGANVHVSLQRYNTTQSTSTTIASGTTDADGRINNIGPTSLTPGEYVLEFDTGAYFTQLKLDTFYPRVRIHFTVDGVRTHYHIPLNLSPNSYSSYRGGL